MACRLLTAFFSFLLFFSNMNAEPFDTTKLNKLITTADQHNQIMGALTVAKKGKVLYNKAWGYRTFNGKEQLKSNTETKFRVGSITKTFTAVMIMQLIEEGKLALTTPLSKFYPTIPNASEITIELLLNHHSGLHNFTDTAYLEYHTQPKSQEELLTMFAQQTPSFKPGANGEYSNTNYVLLGFIIENITGENYAANLKKRITSKVGLKNTYYGSKPDATKNEASSFSYNGMKWEEEPETHMSIPGGAGSLVSTTNDLVKFITALFGNNLVKKTSLQKMLEMKDGYGLGIFQFPFDEKYCYGHTGGIDEFHSMLGYFPKDSVAFAFTGNGQTMEMNDLAIGVLSIYFNRPYEIPNYALEEYKFAAEELSKYEGTYSSSQHPLKIRVWKDGNKLIAQATGQGPFALTAVNEREFKFDRARLKMIFDIKSKTEIKQFTLKQGGGQYVFVKD
ncbi:MAG TPA: serine hydrolase domain-containing protein [Flavipsychrobacter sp.]|nr:serine hydrolase domain-containing protein [Flavipsychrobacter sp.]